MNRPSTLNSSELIDFIAERISHAAHWREGFSDLLTFINMRLATGNGCIRLYNYISKRYLDPVSTKYSTGNPVIDGIFEQLADDKKPVCVPVEYADYLENDRQYSIVGIPIVKNADYLGGLIISGHDGEGIRESQYQGLLALALYLTPVFESAVLQEILLSNYLEAIETLAVALEAKDPFTRGHSNMVTAYAVAIARKVGLDAQTIQAIEIGAMMHDIGKIGVPDEILKKPGALTKDEFKLVMKHTLIGEEILKPMQHPIFAIPRAIIRWHHERIDGKGYPDGLKGDEIPIEAKITFVADAYDAMTSDRPYRGGMAPESAFAELRRHSGTQFDPEYVEVLCELLKPMSGCGGDFDKKKGSEGKK